MTAANATAGRGVGAAALATGALVTGPTLALIGEGRESEYVMPESKFNAAMNGGGTQLVQVILDGRVIAEITAENWPDVLMLEGIKA
jgi:hypothetical protein